jgi:hypothetical protein
VTTRIKWLAGGFAFAFAVFFVWLLLVDNRAAALRHTRPPICEPNEFCDVPRPAPVDLHPAPLARDDPDRRLIAQVAGGGAIEAYSVPGSLQAARPSGNRLFLVQGSALYIVRRLSEGGRAFLIRRGAGLARLIVRTDPELFLDRFALLDPASGRGDTYILRQARGSSSFTYRVLAPDSREIGEEWLASRRSSCGGGPLTAVPEQWVRAYEAVCRAE